MRGASDLESLGPEVLAALARRYLCEELGATEAVFLGDNAWGAVAPGEAGGTLHVVASSYAQPAPVRTALGRWVGSLEVSISRCVVIELRSRGCCQSGLLGSRWTSGGRRTSSKGWRPAGSARSSRRGVPRPGPCAG